MRNLMILVTLLIHIKASQASTAFFCSIYHSKRVINIASNHSAYDKNRHCTVSCMLALKCPNKEVYSVGYLKEFRDLLGYGQPDRADLEANAFGISLVSKRVVRTDEECLSQCDLYYNQ